MCCTTLFANETTMATTQFTRVPCWAVCWPQQESKAVEHNRLRMSWVVVTDKNGKTQLRACWKADQGD